MRNLTHLLLALMVSACGSVTGGGTSNDAGQNDAGDGDGDADAAVPDSSGAIDGPGFQHTIFTTSTTVSPSVGLDAFTKICLDLAAKAGLQGDFVPVIRLNDNPLDNRIQIQGPVFNTNGEMVAVNAAEFFSETYRATNGFSESGDKPGDTVVWVGDDAKNTCIDWTSTDDVQAAAQGNAASTTFLQPVSKISCATLTKRSIMCISQ